jgi:hypothetical protein
MLSSHKELIMNKHLIVSLLTGTTVLLCGIAQEQQRPTPPQAEGIGAQCPMRQKQEGFGQQQQCPMHQQQGGMNQQGQTMRGPMSEVPGQMPLMRGMANQGRQTPGEPTPRRLFADPVALKEAGATDEQMQTFRKFMQEQRLKQVDMRAAIEKAELTLQMLESDEKSKEDDLLKATEKVSQAQAEMLKQETLMKIKVKEIFGEEVVKKLFEANQKKQTQRPQIQQGQGERQGQQRQGIAPRVQAPSTPDAK